MESLNGGAGLSEPRWTFDRLVRVFRGGGCFDSAWFCRSAYRHGQPSLNQYYFGFRLCLCTD